VGVGGVGVICGGGDGGSVERKAREKSEDQALCREYPNT